LNNFSNIFFKYSFDLIIDRLTPIYFFVKKTRNTHFYCMFKYGTLNIVNSYKPNFFLLSKNKRGVRVLRKELIKEQKSKDVKNKYFRHCQSVSRSLQTKIAPLEYRVRNDLFELIKTGDVVSANIYKATLTKTATLSESIPSGEIIGKYKHFFLIQEPNKTSKTTVNINDLIDGTFWVNNLTRKGVLLVKNNLIRKQKESADGLQLRGQQVEVRH